MRLDTSIDDTFDHTTRRQSRIQTDIFLNILSAFFGSICIRHIKRIVVDGIRIKEENADSS